MAIAITLYGFNDLGRSVIPLFLSMGHLPLLIYLGYFNLKTLETMLNCPYQFLKIRLVFTYLIAETSW